MSIRDPGSDFHKDATELGKLLAHPETTFLDLPEPMPARTEDGEQVWLHYRPLRWERHP